MGGRALLSREEIEEFAQAVKLSVPGAGFQSQDVRSYDFGRPEKLSKVNMRALQMVFSTLDRLWTSTLSSKLKTRMRIQANPIQQSSFAAYSASMPHSVVIFTIKCDSLPGAFYLDMPVAFALSAVDRMMGGTGKFAFGPRGITPAQQGILNRLVERLAEDLSKAWEPIGESKFTVTAVSTSADDLDMERSTQMIVFSTHLQSDVVESNMNIAVSVDSLEGVADHLDPQKLVRGETPHTPASDSVTSVLKSVEIPIAVELGHAKVSMKDVLGMEEGDVICLDASVADLLSVKLGGRTRFQGRPGLIGKKVSIQIAERPDGAVQPDADGSGIQDFQTAVGDA